MSTLDPQLLLLATTAASVGFVHTAVGVDHTLPFIVLGRGRAWSLTKTLAITGLCGLGHVGSSVVIAGLALWLGQSALQLAALDQWRGDIAAWALIGFGLAYACAGWLGRAHRHQHYHVHNDGVFHSHEHDAGEFSLLHCSPHNCPHNHPHNVPRRFPPQEAARNAELAVPKPDRASGALSASRLAAALFIVFVTGPCEALVPLLFASGVQGNSVHLGTTVFSFSLATVATMLGLVSVGFVGLRPTWLSRGEGLLHVSTGLAIALSGAGVRFLGL